MLKLAVLQKVINAGENNNEQMPPAIADVWKVARTVGGSHLEYNPEHFRDRIVSYLKLRLREHDKEIRPFYNKLRIKRIDRIYTPDEVIDAFRKAWNDVTKEIKQETIKVL